MSALLMGAVWYIELPPPEQTIMLALADHGKDDGTDIYPSVKMLAWKSGRTERQVQRILRALEQQRLIIAVAFAGGGRGHATRYEMHLENGIRKPAFKLDDELKGDIQGTERVTFRDTSIKGDIAMSPIELKGDIQGTERVTFRTIKGDIAMSPEPSYNHQREEDIKPTAAASPSHAHAHARTREAAAAVWSDNELDQTADAVRQHLRMGRDKLAGLKLILRLYPNRRPWLENEANLCFSTLRVRPLELKHFSNWLQSSEIRRKAQEAKEEASHEATTATGTPEPTGSGQRRPHPETERTLTGEAGAAAIWNAVLARLQAPDDGGAGTLHSVSRDDE